MPARRYLVEFSCALTILLAACGGGGGGSPAPTGPPSPTAPAAPTLAVTYGLKQLFFSWAAVSDATYYRLLESPDTGASFAQIGGNLTTFNFSHDIAVYQRVNAMYRLEACNSVGCTASSAVGLSTNLPNPIGYFKASNTEADDGFSHVALSADGTTLAVGATGEDSSASGINGDQSDDNASNAGAVYVFTRQSSGWTQQAYIKASNTGAGDGFGASVALSADGSTLAVGARREDSINAGVNGNQADDSAQDSGAVYVFARSAGVWTQQAYIKASNPGVDHQFGTAIALDATGDTLAVGAYGERSSATGVNGIQGDNSALFAGAAYVFTRSGAAWSQQAYIKASNTNAQDFFGIAVALSADGSTLAVGAYFEDSGATGVDANQLDNSAPSAGAVYVFTRAAGTWTQQAYVKASNTGANDMFGTFVALSSDGSTLAVAAHDEASAATGIDGDQSDNSAPGAGAVYVFARAASVWTQQAYVKASNTDTGDGFGSYVQLSADGNTLAMAAIGEDSNAFAVNRPQVDNSMSLAGAAYVFTNRAGVWTQQAYVKAGTSETFDQFGISLALSGDGATLAIGAPGEDSQATGVAGDRNNNAATDAGAVWLY
jgi:trimeric autotransporter adhesin